MAWENVNTLGYESVRRVLKAALFTPCGARTANGAGVLWGLPVALVGPPGGSKSSVLWDLAVEWFTAGEGVRFRTLTPGAQGDGAFGVTPIPVTSEDGELALVYPPPEWVRTWAGSVGLVLTDDMAWTPPTVQAAQLDFVQRRVLGDVCMGTGVRVVGATNDVADGGYPIPPAHRNRMVWLTMPPIPPDAFGAYLLGTAERARAGAARAWEAEEQRVLSAWPGAWAKAAMLVAGFVRANPSRLQEEPKDPAVMAWATPRSVEMATRALASAEVHDLDDVETNAFVAGCVGTGWANEFDVYRVNADLPNPTELLDGKVTFEHRRERLDRTFVVLAATSGVLSDAGCPRLLDRGRRFVALASSIVDEAAELLGPPIVALSRSPSGSKVLGLPEASKLLARMEPVISASRRRR